VTLKNCCAQWRINVRASFRGVTNFLAIKSSKDVFLEFYEKFQPNNYANPEDKDKYITQNVRIGLSSPQQSSCTALIVPQQL